MRYFIADCSKRDLEIYLRLHQIFGAKATSLDRFTLSGATESYRTGYYGRINCPEPWITYVDSEKLFHPGRLMLFYYKIEEKNDGCEICGKWRFPSWYRKTSAIYFILPFFLYLANSTKGFSIGDLGIFYLFVFAAYGIFYALSRLSAPEDKITELINGMDRSERISVNQ